MELLIIITITICGVIFFSRFLEIVTDHEQENVWILKAYRVVGSDNEYGKFNKRVKIFKTKYKLSCYIMKCVLSIFYDYVEVYKE